MEYTKNYKLPQWVETDRILMEDFNQAMADIENGITAAKTAAETALTTAAEGVSKATAAQAAADKNCMVKLAEGTISTGTTSKTIDLSGVDMSKMKALQLHVRGTFDATNGIVGIRFNSISSNKYYGNGNLNAQSYLTISGEGTMVATRAEIFPHGDYIGAVYQSVQTAGSYSEAAGGMTNCCTFSAIKSIQLVCYNLNSTYAYRSTSSYELYGITQ